MKARSNDERRTSWILIWQFSKVGCDLVLRLPMHDMTLKEKVRLLKKRFVHRSDTYAIQWLAKESNEWRFWRVAEGKCPEGTKCTPGTCTHKSNVALKEQDVVDHLSGKRTLGVYQLADDDTVKWLCLDVDINKGNDSTADVLINLVQNHTKALAKVLKHLGIPFLVEFSGNRGYHLWIFFEEPVKAKLAMSLGRYISSQVEPPNTLHVEVFPKQTSQGTYGNLVKLPMGIHQKTGNPCEFVSNQFKPLKDQWSALVNVELYTLEELDACIYDNEIPIIDVSRLEVRSGGGKLGLPCMTAIMDRGAGEGKRDLVTFKLACFLKNAGIPSDLATATIEEWNLKNLPPLDPGTLAVKVQSAYSQNYSSFPCQDKEFDEFCSSDCRFYANKMATRGGK